MFTDTQCRHNGILPTVVLYIDICDNKAVKHDKDKRHGGDDIVYLIHYLYLSVILLYFINIGELDIAFPSKKAR